MSCVYDIDWAAGSLTVLSTRPPLGSETLDVKIRLTERVEKSVVYCYIVRGIIVICYVSGVGKPETSGHLRIWFIQNLERGIG